MDLLEHIQMRATKMMENLSCEGTLLAHIQLVILKVLSSRAVLHSYIPQFVQIARVAMTQAQDLAPGFIELHQVHLGLLQETV